MTSSEPAPQEQDGDSLIPALLAVYSAYMVYRAARGRLEGTVEQIAAALGLSALIGAALAQIAARALARQRDDAGRRAEELYPVTAQATLAGVEAGMLTIVDALRWLDTHTEEGAAVTRDFNAGWSTSGSYVPTAEDPPQILAETIAAATAHGAQLEAASAAGWRFKTWVTMRDARVRASHRVMNGQKVSLAEPFVSGHGARLMFPGDPAADVSEWANCRCTLRTSR